MTFNELVNRVPGLKPGHKQNDIYTQAEWYANRVKATGSKTLYLWPRRKSPNAFSEDFRRAVLKRLVGDPGYKHSETLTAYTDRLEAAAQAAGYTIVEIPTREYSPKSIRSDIASEGANQ